MAIWDPLNANSIGAKVPGSCAYPTMTSHQRGLSILKSDANGEFSMVFIGNPLYTAIFPIDPFSTNLTKMNSDSSVKMYRAVSEDVLEGVFDQYRLVAAGFSLANVQPPTTMTGSLWVARVPCNSNFWSPQLWVPTASPSESEVLEELCSIKSESGTNYVPLSIITLKTCQNYISSQLMNGRVKGNVGPINLDAFDFRPAKCSNAYDNTYKVGSLVKVNNSTGVVTQVSDNFSDLGGFCCYLIRGSGFPASSKIFQLETNILIEGTPNIGTGNSSSFVPDTMGYPGNSRISLDNTLAQSSKLLGSRYETTHGQRGRLYGEIFG